MTYSLLYIIFSRYKLAFFIKILHLFTLTLFKTALIKQIIFKLSIVWPYPYLSSLIKWKYYLSDSKSLQNGKYEYL